MNHRRDRMDLFGSSLLIAFSILLGLNQSLVKLVNEGFSPLFQVGIRSLIAMIPIFLFALWRGRKLSISDGSLLPGIVCGLLFSAEFAMLFIALDYTSVSRVSVIFYTMPIWLALAAHFLLPGEKLTLMRSLGLIFALAGIIVVLSEHAGSSNQSAFLLGDIICIGGSMLWASVALITRTTKLSRSVPEMQLLYQLVISGVVMTAIAPLFGDIIRAPTPAIFGYLFFQAVIVVAVGFTVWFWVLSVYPSSDMASFAFLSPLFGVFFGWLIFDDPLSFRLLAALTLVGIGITLVNWRPRSLKK